MKRFTFNHIQKNIERTGQCIINYQPTLEELKQLEALDIYCEPLVIYFEKLDGSIRKKQFFRYFVSE